MKIVFTNHAKYRINERKILIFDIKLTIKNPDKKNVDSHGMIIVNKRFGRKSLEVVYKIRGSNFVVITSYYI